MEKFGFDAALFENNGGKHVRFQAGQQIFREGDSGKVMYLITDGEVTLQSDGDDLSTLWPGDVFGEMAMIDGSARSASALAKSDVDTIILDRDAFLNIVRVQPEFAMYVLTILSVRVRELSCLI